MNYSHDSHKRWVVGGVIFCSKCGCMASMHKKGDISKLCRGKVAKGSQPRLKALLAGSIKGTMLKHWPNGEPVSTKYPVKAFKPQMSTDAEVDLSIGGHPKPPSALFFGKCIHCARRECVCH